MTRRGFALACAVLSSTAILRSQPPKSDVVLQAMEDEIRRSRTLGIVNIERPYYIEYGLHDGESVSVSATLGALVSTRRVRYRLPRVQVRVGDYGFDNTNFVGTDFFTGPRYDVDRFPLDDSYGVLRNHLWLATDAAYKGAAESYARKRAALRNVAAPEEQLADFHRVPPRQMVDEVRLSPVDLDRWAGRLKRLSTVFLDYPAIFWSTVDFDAGRSARYLVTSEGARVRVQEHMSGVVIRASTQAPDGMTLRDAAVFHSLDAAALPPDAELERAARQVGDNVVALLKAPLGDTYAGPVLFEGIAAPQLFAEVLGRNLAVPRRPVSVPGRPLPFAGSELEGRAGSRILPEWMDVVDDPTQAEWHGRRLFGHYTVDLEGIAPAALVLVEKGVLKNFLYTRQPVKGSDGTNGRARLTGRFGHKAAAPGNLFVSASQPVPGLELRKRLIELCQKRSKPYGLIVRKMDFPSSAGLDELQRLFASVQPGSGSSVSLPLLVYRVYPDGREELVRGLRFRGLGTRSLKDIIAASAEQYVLDYLENSAPFAVMGGASFVSETSVIAPSVLFEDLELERMNEQLPKPPLVPAPALLASTEPRP